MNDLTGPLYWDAWWSSESFPQVSDSDSFYGKDGYFLKAINRQTPLNGKSIVELGGCISYRLAAIAKFHRVKAACVDYSPIGIQASRKFFAECGCDVDLHCGDFFSPSLDDLRFDVVCHWGVLEHQVDPVPLIRRSVQLAQEAVIFTMPNMKALGAYLWKKMSPVNWSHHIYHSDDLIVSAFKRLGWTCKPFFWGQPLIYTYTGKERSVVIRKFSNAIAKLPLPYDRGLRYVSTERGFIAFKHQLCAAEQS